MARPMQIDLEGLHALVTGSTRGIGRAIALRLAKFGATVAVNGRSASLTADAVAGLRAECPAAEFIEAAGDIATAEGTAAVFATAGTIDILVNNVGVYPAVAPFEINDDQWTAIFQDNVLTTVRMIRHYGPQMATRRWGRIVCIGSEAGVHPPTELIHYAASKAAQHVATRGFAQALAGTGVTVNTVLVGPTSYPEATRARTARAEAAGLSHDDYMARFFREQRPSALLGRYVEADEIADLVAFIVSREAKFATGASWRADCGTIQSVA